MQDKVLSMIGLATRAGKLVSGEFMTEREVKAHRAELVLLALDASENTKDHFRAMCSFHQIPICFYGDKESLGRAMGKEVRASLAVLDQGFAKSILKQVESVKSKQDEGGC